MVYYKWWYHWWNRERERSKMISTRTPTFFIFQHCDEKAGVGNTTLPKVAALRCARTTFAATEETVSLGEFIRLHGSDSECQATAQSFVFLRLYIHNISKVSWYDRHRWMVIAELRLSRITFRHTIALALSDSSGQPREWSMYYIMKQQIYCPHIGIHVDTAVKDCCSFPRYVWQVKYERTVQMSEQLDKWSLCPSIFCGHCRKLLRAPSPWFHCNDWQVLQKHALNSYCKGNIDTSGDYIPWQQGTTVWYPLICPNK